MKTLKTYTVDIKMKLEIDARDEDAIKEMFANGENTPFICMSSTALGGFFIASKRGVEITNIARTDRDRSKF